MTEPEPVEELWTFGGVRVGSGNKKVYAWFPAGVTTEKEALIYPAGKGPMPAVGGVYRIRVSRTERVDKGKTIAVTSKYADHRFERRSDDDELRARLELAHRMAETELAAFKREGDAKRDSALTDAMAPLLALAESVGPFDRDAFAVLVLRKLHTVWFGGRRR